VDDEQVTRENEYPDLHVGYDPQVVAENTIAEVFSRLLELDMDQVRDAIFGRGKNEPSGDDDYIIVTTPDADEGGPILELSLKSITWFDVRVDPRKFARSNPKQEAIYQRCATLVKALHESRYGADANYEHPELGGFTFWCCKEDQTAEEAASEWEKIAEIWQV
jgi:hypothetical protein